MELVPGADYTLVFTARGAEGRDLKAGIGDAASPYYNDTVTLQLTDDWLTLTKRLANITLHLTAF